MSFLLLLFIFGTQIVESSISVDRSDEIFFETGVRNVLRLNNTEGPWTCNSQNSEFASYSISIASFNATLGANSTQFVELDSCSPLSASGLNTPSPLMRIQCLYDSSSFGTFQLKSFVNCKNGFQSEPSESNVFFYLGEEGSIISLSQLESDPTLLSSSFKFQVSSKSFKDEETVSGLYFQSISNVEGTVPSGFEEPYWGSLSFELDALTPNGFRPSGPLNEPITVKFNWEDFEFSKEEAESLSLFYLDSKTNSFVSVASSCGLSNYTFVNATERTFTSRICHLTPYKAFVSSPTPTTAQTTTNSIFTQIITRPISESNSNSESNSETLSIASQTGSNTQAAVLGAQNTNSKGLATGAIIGIVVGIVGGIILIVLVVFLVVYFKKRNQSEERERKRQPHSPEALNEMYMNGGGMSSRQNARTASWIKASGRKTVINEDEEDSPPPTYESDSDGSKAKVRNVKVTFDQPEKTTEQSSSEDESEESESSEESEQEEKVSASADAIVSGEKEDKSEDENSENEERSSSSQSSEESDDEDELPPYSKAIASSNLE
eukprot:TRINITY_DN626_c0_g2_i1.p1 TRINITY_DN626_c0_g2~~TRINITY_DN626_c0_g2_i1.p1  ORF type:complete len:609 (+),score=257.46 TRINITY_DN626_c0_g2_i1:177-1829(+)